MRFVIKVLGLFCAFFVVFIILCRFFLNILLTSWIYPVLEDKYQVELSSQSSAYNPLTTVMTINQATVDVVNNNADKIAINFPCIKFKFNPLEYFITSQINFDYINIKKGVITLFDSGQTETNNQITKNYSSNINRINKKIKNSLNEESVKMPEKFIINTFSLNTDIRYIHGKSNTDILYHFACLGSNLSNIKKNNWGSVHLIAESMHADDLMKLQIYIKHAPIVDINHLSFNLRGNIKEVNPHLFGLHLEKPGINFSTFDLEPNIVCSSGRLDGSEVKICLKDIKVGQGSNITEINELQFITPLSGSFKKPKFDIHKALIDSIPLNSSFLIGSALETIMNELIDFDYPVKNIANEFVDIIDQPLKEIIDVPESIFDSGLGFFEYLIRIGDKPESDHRMDNNFEKK